METGDVPHLLFFGKAGTGKTTLAKLIVNSINCDHIIINASDENNVDTVRNKVKSFVSTVGFKDLKIVILDEFDYMTPNAQAILRNLMETFSKHCRFILTCNYVEKVIDPIQSRCQTFQIVPPTKKDVAVQISQILGKEGVSFEPRDLVPIIDSAYPDIRKIINTIQGSIVDGVCKIDDNSLKNSQLGDKIVDALEKKLKLSVIRQILADSGAREFDGLFKVLYDNVSKYTNREGEAILIIAKYQYEYTFVLEKEICIAAMLNKLLDIC